MKKYSIQLIITIFIIFALSGMSRQEASAYKIKIKTEKTGPYIEKMGDEMFDVAQKGAHFYFKSYWKEVKEDGNDHVSRVFAGIDATKKDTFTLCKPYVIWCDSETHSLYPQYYFPVAVKGKIAALVQVFGRIEETEYVGADIIYMHYEEYEQEIAGLNKLDYLHKDYIFFLHGGIILAQSEDGKIVKLNSSAEPSREPTDGENFFYALDYNKKLELTIAQMDDYMTHEELMALNEKTSVSDPIIKGTDADSGTAPASKQAASTLKPDMSEETTTDNSHGFLPAAIVAGGVAVLVIVLIIAKVKRMHSKGIDE